MLSVNAAFEGRPSEKQVEPHLSRGCQMLELGAQEGEWGGIGGVELRRDFCHEVYWQQTNDGEVS